MKKVVYLVFCLIYLISSCIPVFGQDYDYGNSWAKNEIDYMKNRGIVSGYPDGTFKPSNNMSKAEFYKIVNSIMGFTQKSEINFNDVVPENWYYDEVMKGVAANYIIPAESLNAGENITRGEVARIIGIVFGIEEDKSEASNFEDSMTFPEELKGIIGGLKKNGFINGYPDGTFKVDAEITRAEVVKILHEISGEIINEECTVNTSTDKNLVVNTTDVTLKDTTIGGNLYLAEGIGEGSIFLENVTVKSKVIVNGGGASSINIRNSELNSLLADKKQGLVNIVFSDAKAEEVKTVNQVRLQLSQGSQINKLELKDNANLILDKSASIESLIITGKDIVINSQGTIKYIKSASQFKINGTTAKAGIEYKMLDGKFEELNKTSTTNTDPVYVDPVIPENPGVNKTGLAAAISQAQAKNEELYTEESWITFADALSSAIAVNNDEEATQDEVDTAFANLTAAMNGLVEKEDPVDPEVDKTQLVVAINQAQAKNEENYTEESWAPFAEALELAIQVRDNEEATQEEVDEALANLTAAMNGLVEKEEPADPQITNIMPNEDVTLSAGQELTVSFNAPEGGTARFRILVSIQSSNITNSNDYKKIMNEVSPGYYSAEWTVHEGIAGTFEIEVNYEKDGHKLRDIAEGKLIIEQNPVDPPVDKTQLVAAIAQAQEKNEEDYTEESWEPFAQALESAIAVNNNEEATQEQVDEALVNLITTMNELVVKEDPVDPEVDKTQLVEAITEAQTKNEEDYTEESWAPFAEALELAMQVRDNEEATQEEVDGVLASLRSAMNALVVKEDPVDPEVDKTQLVEVIAEALTKNEEDYTEESWAPFAQALQSAIEVRDNEEATQEQVDEALANLTAAMDLLVEEDRPTPEIIATFHRSMIGNFGHISIQVQNIEGAAKFDVVYHLSDNPDGSQNIQETQIVDIGQRAGLIFYDPNQYNTITIRIYDVNKVLLYTFTDIVPVQ